MKQDDIKTMKKDDIKTMKQADIKTMLRGSELWITNNRMKIIECLIDHFHFHSIGEILKHIKGLNTKSVYNSIATLMEAGIVESYSFNGVTKYGISYEYIGLKNNIHLVINNEFVENLEVSEEVFAKIRESVKEIDKNVKSIKIFVHVDVDI